jgi:peptidoglycan/LPS O-acetylase OafA/YrhL
MRHSANLDILRTFAVSSVLAQHLVSTLITHAGLHNIAVIEFMGPIGRAGVIAFFVHTSLVLMYSLERMTRSTNRVSLRFYVRRFFRIYPLSVFCITLAVILHIPNTVWKTPDVTTPLVILANLFLVQNLITKISVIIPLWSLPYEVQMYLVLPALYYLALKKRGVIYLCGLLVFFCGLGFLIAGESGGHLNMAAYVPCFLSGVLCYALRDRIQAFVPSALWPPFVLLLISGYCLANLYGDPKFWVGWIFCLLLGLSVNAFHDSTNRPLNVVAERIALYSYGVYLIHVPVLYFIFMVLGIKNLIAGTLLLIVLTLVASIITYHFIESPFMDIGRRLSSSPAPTPVPLAAQNTQEGS